MEGELTTPDRPPDGPTKVMVPRWLQVAVLVLGGLLLSSVASAAAPVMVVFTVASVIALILNPLVARVSSRLRVRRGFAVSLVYVGFFVTVVAIGALLANPIASQVREINRGLPKLSHNASHTLTSAQHWFDRHNVHVQIVKQGQSAIAVLERQISKRSGDVLSFSQSLLQSAASFSFSLILVFVISVYMLLYAESIGRLVRSVMPPGDGTADDDYPTAVQRAVFGYVRGQLLFSIVMGASAGASMWLAGAIGLFPEGRTYAVAFGLFYGLMELIPYIGPVLGAIPPIVVALLNHPLDALWVALIFLALQQVEGHVVAPQIFSHSLRINPLLVIFALLFGAELYGIIGALLALPIAAVVRQTAIYLRRHTALEPWGSYAQQPPGSG
jgi:predicted PurR-regulated permease PerM